MGTEGLARVVSRPLEIRPLNAMRKHSQPIPRVPCAAPEGPHWPSDTIALPLLIQFLHVLVAAVRGSPLDSKGVVLGQGPLVLCREGAFFFVQVHNAPDGL